MKMKKMNKFILPSRKAILASHQAGEEDVYMPESKLEEDGQKNIYTYKGSSSDKSIPVKNPLYEMFNASDSRETLELKLELDAKEKALREMEKKFIATQRSLAEREMLSKAKEDYLKNRSLQICDREARLLKQIKEQKNNAPMATVHSDEMDDRIKREMERLNNFSSELDKRDYELREREQMLQERESFAEESENTLMSKAQELHEKEMEIEIREDALKSKRNELKSA